MTNSNKFMNEDKMLSLKKQVALLSRFLKDFYIKTREEFPV